MLEHSPPTPSPQRLRISHAREIMREQLLGETSAMDACGAYGEVCDQLVIDRVGPAAEAGLAVIATGGWGRSELCPYSDLDILFLAEDLPDPGPDPQGSGIGQVISEDFLFPLWDAGLKVGHSVTDLASIETLAKSDVRTATALLDARLIAGRTDLFLRLEQTCRRVIAPGGDPRIFVGRLIDERDRRHRRFGDSLYLLEPNLKQGIGGLRDLATAIWVAQVRFGLVSPDRLVTSGQLTRRQATVLMSSRDFLLRLRSLVQLFAKRTTDQLTFELQETIAPLLYPFAEAASAGKTRSAVAPAVEELMRDTYLHGSGVTQIMSQLFESAQSRRRRPTVARIDGSFVLFSGKLSVSSADVFDRRPAEMLRAFRLAARLGVDIHWHTRELIAQRTAMGLDLTNDRAAAEHFIGALCDIGDTRSPSMLEEMHRVGLVAAVIPAFGPCTGRVQHDLYHVYTVDQHQLHAVNMLKRIARRELESDYPLATEIFAALPSHEALFLAVLLHDVGKPLGKGHSETGAEIARDAALALGLGPENAARAEFLVRQHLTMSHVSQRRDLSDPAVIDRFVGRVGSLNCLRELTLLTMCDTAMTAPGNLTTWKAQLLGELFSNAHRVLDGDSKVVERHDDLIGRRRRDLAKLLGRGELDNADEMSALAASIDDHMVVGLKTGQLHRLLSLATEFDGEQPFVFNVRPFPGKAHTELAVVAADTPGLLADITGALAVSGVHVLGAIIGSVQHRGHRLVADMFFIRGPEDAVLAPSDNRWERVVEELSETLSDVGKGSLVENRLHRRRVGGLKPRVTPHVRTEIGFADAESDRSSVLEVFTQDRVGLLSDIARSLSSMNLEIVLAMISTEGERAADAFYVVERDDGAKLSVPRQRQVVRELKQRFVELESAELATGQGQIT